MTRVAPHTLLDAREATSAWDLHRVSFSYKSQFMFPLEEAVPQSVLITSIKELAKTEAGTGRGSMMGWGPGYAEKALYCVTPWSPERAVPPEAEASCLILTLNAEGSNLDELAFQVHRHFDFVADSMWGVLENITHLQGRIVAKRMGWTRIPGYRKGKGSLGHAPGERGDDDF